MNAPDLKTIKDAELDRTTYIGGSDAAAIVGLGAYGKTPLSVYLSKIGESVETIDFDKQRFLERRKRWEGPIFEMLREEFDCKIVDVNKRYVDAEHPFIASEIDFEWVDPETGAIENGEVKTVSPFAFGDGYGWGDAGTDEIPVHYAAQAMHGLGVMNRNVCIVAAMIGLDRMIFYRVNRDEETIAEMRAQCVKFWTEHVLKRVPPDPITLQDCVRIMKKLDGMQIDADEDLLEDIRSLKGLREHKAAMRSEEAELMGSIAIRIVKHCVENKQPADAGKMLINVAGKELCSWNAQKVSRFDVKALQEAQPDIYGKYLKTTQTRVLRFKKPKKA